MMARPRRQAQFAPLADLDCDERVVHLKSVQTARAALPESAELTRLSDLLSLKADPTRLRIVAALDSAELCVCDLAATIGISESAISHHLRPMRHLNLVRSRREGRRVFYSLDDDQVMSIYRKGRDHVAHQLNGYGR
jgi:DNA-binding transcriptional ArsR family regulator